MESKKITLNLTEKQYLDLVKLITLGGMVVEEIVDDEPMARFLDVQQQFFAASGEKKGNLFIGYDKKENEYFVSDDIEEELLELVNEYDESRFWESLVMRLTLRDLQKKFSEKELREMTEEKGTREMEKLHEFYISEFDDNDIDNLKVVSMKRV